MRASDLGTIESAARLVKERSTSGEASELASLLAVFGARRYGNDAMRALIRRLFMSTEVLDTSPLYREWVEKAQAEGMAKGIAEGLEKGIVEGRAEGREKGIAEGEARGIREAVRTVLEARFQTLDAGLLAALDAAPLDALKDTLRHVTTDSLDEARAA